jgi:branched-chain amino acid transport system ATP-binding protein
MMLVLENLVVNYERIQAVKGISVVIKEGQVCAIIGANGAGKSTTLNAITGLIRPFAGKILYQGRDITRADTDLIVRSGIAMCPEGRQVFATLTVRENLILGAYPQKDKKMIETNMANVYAMFPQLRGREQQPAGTLSGGEQQMLTIGRALMNAPKMLLLDEPSLGLAPLLVKEIFQYIDRIREQGVTILLVEQNANMALKYADYCYVMETGKIKLAGTPEELKTNEELKKAYLGG